MSAYKTLLDAIDTAVKFARGDFTGAFERLFSRDVARDKGLLDRYAQNAQIEEKTGTTVNFVGANVGRPIYLGYDGRIGFADALPSALTISGTAGTKYVYADLGAPDGNGNSAITLVQATTAPSSETTAYRAPLGAVEWSGSAIIRVLPYFLNTFPAKQFHADWLAVGASHARSGRQIRLPNSGGLEIRNAGDTADVGRILFKHIDDLANNGTINLNDVIGTTDCAFLVVIGATAGDRNIGGMFLRGSAQAVYEVFDPQGEFSNTAGTASSINIYWSAGNARYELENKRGGARDFLVVIFASTEG